MTPYYERGGIRIFHGDARQVLPDLVDECFDAVVTDPVWPDVKTVRLAGFEEARELFAFAAHHAAIFAERLVVYLSRETDPRFLATVPASMPYLCTSWLRFIVPRPVGRILRGANVAYTFGVARRPVRALTSCRAPRRPSTRTPSKSRAPTRTTEGVSRSSSSVLDPFCGSGTVLVAAKEHGIPAVGVEVEERYCEVAAKRLAQDSLFPPATSVALAASDRPGDDKAALAEPQERRAP